MNFFYIVLLGIGMIFTMIYGLSQEATNKGFVYLHDVDPTIHVSLRYFSQENFLGEPVNGYTKKVVMMTKQLAIALKKVQQDVNNDGYSLVVYDAYRPQRAVNHFIRWAADTSQIKKLTYYPRIDKKRVFELAYISKKSGHSRGSTVDITLIKKGHAVHAVKPVTRMLSDGFVFTFLDDGTVDMGSHFDLFDIASHYENNLIEDKFKKIRTYLREKMLAHGFKPCAAEWWHFTLKDEPYKATYFDFVVE